MPNQYRVVTQQTIIRRVDYIYEGDSAVDAFHHVKVQGIEPHDEEDLHVHEELMRIEYLDGGDDPELDELRRFLRFHTPGNIRDWQEIADKLATYIGDPTVIALVEPDE